MNKLVNKLGKKITGVISVPGDKSISIRAVLISSFFYGDFNFQNFNFCDDTKAALNCMKILAENENKKSIILDCKNSATTMRLLAGLICGMYHDSCIKFKLIGDKSLSKRPMDRIIIPLKKMGADIMSKNGITPPLYINYTKKSIQIKCKDDNCKCHDNYANLHHLNDLIYKSNISSAQVKSCLELASYCAGTKLVYYEPYKSRNHTEIMLKYFSKIYKNGNTLNYNYIIPGDISSAAFFITNAILYKDSNITINDVLINETRMGFINCLKEAGIKINIIDKKILQNEKVGSISIKNTGGFSIKSLDIDKKTIPTLIDEIPLLAIILSMANGVSHIKDISELKFKESNRLIAISDIFKILNIKHNVTNSSLTIYGNKNFNIANITKEQKKSLEQYNSKDHRIILLLKILGCQNIKNQKYINTSI